jgi:toxin ParE1/3/4
MQDGSPPVIVRWTRRALGNLQRITEHIADDNPLAAAEFVATVRGSAARLQRFPLLGRIGAFQDTRELVVHRNYISNYRARVRLRERRRSGASVLAERSVEAFAAEAGVLCHVQHALGALADRHATA